MNEKIKPEHLHRAAYVYVRQSTAYQVRHHLEGQQRQYDLGHRARQLGFEEVVVIDEDLGRSGSGLQERPGFGRLLAAVCQGLAGAVLALEASRLARNNRDWHHLIDLCALTRTVIIDDDGIYDPKVLNDRLLLGLKGTMSEFELGLMRQRARTAYLQKVRREEVMWEVPVGFVLPHAVAGSAGIDVVWKPATVSRVQQILRNPCYAGAFAFGRTCARTVASEGRLHHRATRRQRPRDEWEVLLLDHHAGYISWNTIFSTFHQ